MTPSKVSHPIGLSSFVRVATLSAALAIAPASAQDQATKSDDLDVTMQIIVDPNAQLPDDVVRHIPLPTARSTTNADAVKKSPPTAASDDSKTSQEVREVKEAKEATQDAKELGKDAKEAAREQAREAAEQREEAKNAKDKDRDTDHGRPDRPHPPHPRN